VQKHTFSYCSLVCSSLGSLIITLIVRIVIIEKGSVCPKAYLALVEGRWLYYNGTWGDSEQSRGQRDLLGPAERFKCVRDFKSIIRQEGLIMDQNLIAFSLGQGKARIYTTLLKLVRLIQDIKACPIHQHRAM
jgi:hypothetical protein